MIIACMPLVFCCVYFLGGRSVVYDVISCSMRCVVIISWVYIIRVCMCMFSLCRITQSQSPFALSSHVLCEHEIRQIHIVQTVFSSNSSTYYVCSYLYTVCILTHSHSVSSKPRTLQTVCSHSDTHCPSIH